MTNTGIQLDKSSVIGKFYNETKGSTPEKISTALEYSSEILTCHKLTHDPKSSLKKKDLERVNYLITRTESDEYSSFNHFICFLQKDDVLYEMDSRRLGPVNRGKTSSKTFLKDATTCIQDYIKMSIESHLFSLVAFCKTQIE